jgi:aminoglycoside 6'-N-acetyltransferase
MRFRRTERDDLILIKKWLSTPHVARFWNHDTSDEAVERDFGGSIDGTEPCEDFIVLYDEQPIGLIQRYLFSAYPEDLAEIETLLKVPAFAMSIDYFIGDVEMTGRGHGTQMIRAMVESCWVDHPKTDTIIVPVAVANPASWRALLSAGFTQVATGYLKPDNPVDDGQHHLFRIDRPSGR